MLRPIKTTSHRKTNSDAIILTDFPKEQACWQKKIWRFYQHATAAKEARKIGKPESTQRAQYGQKPKSLKAQKSCSVFHSTPSSHNHNYDIRDQNR
ncbi:hypothetical protein [Bartonella birtlesii]|uniref:hypothetical protein n=1 Tax=Bartonella birtlesii TaxID=111504 RepID=UPI00130EF7D7|nr:hypothetical protein [Bartonella birtlesii]